MSLSIRDTHSNLRFGYRVPQRHAGRDREFSTPMEEEGKVLDKERIQLQLSASFFVLAAT
jgi:hypothetical protein